jgi:chromosome segregation ATPase
MQLKDLGNLSNVLKNINSSNNIADSFNALEVSMQKCVLTSGKLSVAQLDAINSGTIWKSNIDGTMVSVSGLSKTELEAAISTTTLSTSQTTATATTTGFGTALKGLWATMMANPLIAIGVAVTAISTAWNIYNQSIEKTRQASADAAGALNETTSSINDYAEKYKKLHDELVKANTTEERQHEIKSDLLALQQELNDKYGDEYGKLNLVTDAYNDQTDAILARNKAAAQNYLLENRKGIADAAKQMEQDRTYTLGSTGNLSNDYAKEIYRIASKYSDHGIKLESLKNNGVDAYTIKFYGNAENAEKVIRNLSNEIQDLGQKYEDNNFINGFLDNSTNALKENQKVLDKYDEIYNSALMSQIATDNELSEGYNKATTAVKAYNDALISGDESKILSARDDLNEVKNSIDLTSDNWKRYGNVMTDIFDQANTGLYDFRDALSSNNDNIKEYAKSLKGLSKADLLSMADDGKDDNFDKIIRSADKYGLSVNQVIDELIRLKYIQNDISKSGETAFSPLSKQEVISNINSLSEGFESLDKIMKSISDKDNPFDYALLDDGKFTKIFTTLNDGGEAYTNFIEKVSSSPKDIKASQSAFDDLVTTWIDSSGVLDGLTEDNKSLATAMLQNMGVANAEEVVMSRLAIAQEHLAAQKAYTAEVSNDLANATASEIPGIIDEATQSDIAKVALAGLVLEKEFFNGNSLDTSGDIENIISLVGVIGTANTALQALNTLKAGGNVGGNIGGKEGYDALVRNAQQEVDNAIKSASEYKGKGANVNATYNGGTKTNKPSSGSKKDKKDFSEIFDWVETTIKRVDEKIQGLQDKISDTSNWKPKNALTNTAIDEMSIKLAALQSQMDTYQKKADSYSLSPTYIDKIKNGTLEIETITDEVIANNIKGYQEWYNKAEDVRKKIDDTKKTMKELAQTKLDNIINDFDSLVSLMNKYTSYSNNLLNLQKELGESITNTDYEQLINQQESIYKQLQSKYNTLSDELSKAVSKGTIKAGSEEWRKYQEELIAVNSSMNDAVSSMNDFRKALINLPFEELEMISGTLDRINNGISTMANLIGDDGLMDGGMLTSKGLAKIALLGQQYTNAKQQAADYGEAISAINEMYENGSLTQAEYNEKLNEYTNAQLSAVKATKEAEQAILQFRYNAIQAQIDDMNELISAKKKALQTEKDYQDYLDGINNKQTDINNLQTKIDELSLSTDRKDIAQRLQLEQQLSDAKKDLAKTQADYAYDKTIESLDKQASDYEDAKKKELDELKSSTDAQKKVIEEYLGQVKDNYKTVYNTLTKYGTDYNVTMTSELTSPWESANSAVSTFKDAVSDAISQINIDIANIDLSRLTELVSTMQGFSAGGNSSASFEDITGSGSWQKNSKGWWYGASNDDYASDGIYTIGGKQYNFNEDGYMKTGWDESSGQWRYFEPENGQMVKSAWRKSKDGKDYYLKSDGTMATDMAIKAKDGNGYYYVDDNGVWDGKTISYDDVKKKNITVGYKSGTTNSKPGLKYVNENGPELIVAKNGTVLNSVGGDTIFDNESTKRLWEFAHNPELFESFKKSIGAINLNVPKYNLDTLRNVGRSEPVTIQMNSPLMVVEGNADEKVLTQINARLNVLIDKEIPQKMMEMSKQY